MLLCVLYTSVHVYFEYFVGYRNLFFKNWIIFTKNIITNDKATHINTNNNIFNAIYNSFLFGLICSHVLMMLYINNKKKSNIECN